MNEARMCVKGKLFSYVPVGTTKDMGILCSDKHALLFMTAIRAGFKRVRHISALHGFMTQGLKQTRHRHTALTRSPAQLRRW